MSEFDTIVDTLLSDLIDAVHNVDGVRTDESGYDTRGYDLLEITKRARDWISASLAKQEKLIYSWEHGGAC